MELSVIIPVFNGADTLQRCLDSVIGQQIGGMEIILVDDGSKDNSLQICTQYAEKHAAITVIHQTNKGLSEARNAALEVAKADYVTFIDCDDYLEPHTYKGLMNRLKKHENIDILEYSVDERIGGKHHTRLQLPDRLFTNWQSYWLKTKAYKHAYAWNKIFRKALFAEALQKHHDNLAWLLSLHVQSTGNYGKCQWASLGIYAPYPLQNHETMR